MIAGMCVPALPAGIPGASGQTGKNAVDNAPAG